MRQTKFKISFLTLLLAFFSSIAMQAQNITASGTVMDNAGEPVIGASVVQKGQSSVGTITDIDGRFQLVVPQGAELQISYIGFAPQTLAARQNMRITLLEEDNTLSDVVVVGYGVQKKSVVTAAIAKVSSDDLAKTSPIRMDNALKGLAAGVTVTSSSGQPGAAAQIRVRGIGTIHNSDPIYIVDGMPIEGGLDYLNPSDIQSIEVLKDAASAAIYGARGANGVIIVTTKTGKVGKTQVNYDFSYGWQSAWRRRDVLNASEYAVMMNEGRLNAGMAPIYNDPYSYGTGTDWQKEVFNDNAPVKNHQLSISGANEKGNYLLSAGYYEQDGIIGGNYNRSNYQRLTLRSNANYNVFDESKVRNWLNNLKITVNAGYARVKSTGITTNSQWGSALGSALTLSPILTPYLTGADADAQNALYTDVDGNYTNNYVPMYTSDGKLYMVPGSSYNEMVNPLASLALPGSQGWSHKVVANVAADLQIWDGIRFRSSYSADLSFWGSDGYTYPFYLSGNNLAIRSSANSSSERGTVWQLENVLTYDKTFGKHTVNVVLGQSANQNRSYYLGGSSALLRNYDKPYISYSYGAGDEPVTLNTHEVTYTDENGKEQTVTVLDGYQTNLSVYGGKNSYVTRASLFMRASYNYDEKYMAQFTVRRDGSSNFGWNKHYGTFPSFSLGWNVVREDFMKNTRDWLDNFKVRLSWGKNGNDAIGAFRYTVLTASGNNYIFGSSETVASGTKASGLANMDLAWEESSQFDFGLDFGFIGNALTFSIDYYNKRTNGMLMTMNIPSYVGESKPTGNVGKMENQGIEMEAGYRWRVGKDLNFSVKGNLSYLKNKLIEYGNETGWANYDSFQGTGTISRAENGEPFPFFYGYKTNGILQNIDEAEAYNSAYGTTCVPGDLRIVDTNNDGTITDADRTKIGKGMPDWTFGLNFTMTYKNFDFSMMWQGTAGNDIYDATRRTDITSANLPSWMLSRWTGEGTSNKIPRFALGDNWNWQSSDILVHDGSYLRLKNIQFGYTIPRSLTQKAFINSLRLYVAAENLLTFTKYHGYDPEISSGGTSLGVDYGVYPQARTFTVGVNVAF